MGLKHMAGTPWHKERFARQEGDERRHKSHCVYYKWETIFYKGIMPSEKILDLPVDCNTLTGSVNL